jgi:hypothetical protein
MALLGAATLLAIFGNTRITRAQSVPVTAGYRDFHFGATVSAEPTSEKPQSKLWWNNGSWWGSLWNPAANRYEIHRFEVATQSWTTTGIEIDSRIGSRADALWDGQHLYIVSQVYATTAVPAAAVNSGRLYRYSYNAGIKSYSPDAGFPVNVNSSKSETLVLDKDSTGKLWVTWVENGKVKVNRTLGNDLAWGAPFDLPGQGNDTDPDDISTLVAFGGNKIGILWSNQKDSANYFMVHRDGDADEVWQPRETALSVPALGAVAEDQLNLKAACDANGNIYAAAATNLSGSSKPGLFVLKRSAAGVWNQSVFAMAHLEHSRPALLINNENQRLYVFARSNNTGRRIVYMKSASLNDLAFPAGPGVPIIQSATDININNPTATKQCVNSSTGILILAGDKDSRYYLHNHIDLIASAPKITSFLPANGPAGTVVTIAGKNFTSATKVSFNGVAAVSFTANSDTQLRATVPVGAASGKITVVNAYDAGSSATAYIVLTAPPAISSFTPTNGPSGTEVKIIGANFTGANKVEFNGTSAAGFVVDSNTQIRATVPMGASAGPISVTSSTGTGSSATSFIVQHPLTLTFVGAGSVNLNPNGSVFDEGTLVTLTAVPAPGWEFSDWDGDLEGTASVDTIRMNAAKRVTAKFKAIPQYSVTVRIAGAGKVALDPPSSGGLPAGAYYHDTIVKLTAAPAFGYVFSGYSGDFNGWMNVETLKIDGNKNLTATFSPLPKPRYASGIWTSAAEVKKLPISGLGWDNLKEGADKPIGPPNLSNRADSVNVAILAKALVYARTGDESYRQAVIAACMAAIGTEQNGETLDLGRELLAYVLAADLVGLPPTEKTMFRNWLRNTLTEVLRGQTLRSSHETRPNNWGTHCGASRAAAARYLGDATELERVARVFKGWLGDRNTYADFSYGPLDWQANPSAPVGINPLGAMLSGHSVDGVLPDDQRRSGPFVWPPPKENYVYGALQGALMQAIILYRAGYDVWNWENRALYRALKWLYNEADYPADGDDEWLLHIINHFYKTGFPAPFPTNPGKNVGWTGWLYGSRYALTVSDNNGDIEIYSLGVIKDSLAVIKLTAIPSPGYLFSGWSSDLSGAKNPDTLIMNANKNVAANFVKAGPFTVTVTASGSGTVALNPPGSVYYGGTIVTVTATANPGFKFIGWSGGLTGAANPAQFMVTANKNIIATFKALYDLTADTVGSGAVALNPPGGTYEAGTVVTLIPQSGTGYQFVEWSGDLSGSANPATITMDAHKHVTATFAAIGVVHEETQTGGASFSTTVATSESLTSMRDHLYLAAISAKPNTAVSSVSGLGLAWTRVGALCAGRNQTGIEVWMAQGIPQGGNNGAVTATLASAPSNAAIAVSRYSGVAPQGGVGNMISGNINGVNGTCSGVVDGNSYAFDLTTTVHGAVVYSAATMRHRTHTPGAGYVERVEIRQGSSSSMASIAVQDKVIPSAGTVTVNGTFSGSTDWALVAVEIKPQAGAPLSIDSSEDGTTTDSAKPADFQLHNYPNPFTAQTNIEFTLPAPARVSLLIHNLTGQRVRTMFDAVRPAGHTRLQWNGRDEHGRELGSGIYLLHLEAGSQRLTKRIILLK